MQHNERKTPPHLYGYVGFCCSKFGKWWGGYSGVRKARPEYRIAEKSYQISARENLLAQVPLMSTVELHHVDYRKLPVPNEPCIIYCDPPYQDTTTYKSTQIDYAEFWQWCRVMHQQGNRVFVSGYSAPSDFTLLWEGRTVSMEATGATEKLYTI
jgi:DNA adenine methylase